MSKRKSSSAAPWLVLGAVAAAGVVVYLVTKSSSPATSTTNAGTTTTPPGGSQLPAGGTSSGLTNPVVSGHTQHVVLTAPMVTAQAAIGDTISLELPPGAYWQEPSTLAVQPGTNAPVVFQYVGPTTFQMSWRDRIVHATTTVNLVTA